MDKKVRCVTALLLLLLGMSAKAETPVPDAMQAFTQVYKQQLGGVLACQKDIAVEYRLCSSRLRNAGVAPFILHHGKVTDKVIVLLHGLSDSPFYFRSIADALYQQGHNVVVGLAPAHGLKEPETAMSASDLGEQWLSHAVLLVEATRGLGEHLVVGGFSTGGAVALNYALTQPDVDGLMLFSGALKLAGWFENLTVLPGMYWVGNIMDGDYQGDGPNPYKYPAVSSHGGVHLMAIIRQNRGLIRDKGLQIPLFIAHSKADRTTDIKGVDELAQAHRGQVVRFTLEQAEDVCHADLMLTRAQVEQIAFDASQLQEVTPCQVPGFNPRHGEMLEKAIGFVALVGKV